MRTRLREIRKARGYTQRLMASSLGMTETGYRAIETGIRDGTIETWRNIVALLRIPSREAWEAMSER